LNMKLKCLVLNGNDQDCQFILTYRDDYDERINPLKNATSTVPSMGMVEVMPSWYGWQYESPGIQVESGPHQLLLATSSCPVTVIANNFDNSTRQGDSFLGEQDWRPRWRVTPTLVLKMLTHYSPSDSNPENTASPVGTSSGHHRSATEPKDDLRTRECLAGAHLFQCSLLYPRKPEGSCQRYDSPPNHFRLWVLAVFDDSRAAWSLHRPDLIILAIVRLLHGEQLRICEQNLFPATTCGPLPPNFAKRLDH
uniref:Plastocyanin-like domain-containing protein n=1 Tax=Heligmosomoides polygyrus TaxID=6339 RepID=A0A183F954_HELPZ